MAKLAKLIKKEKTKTDLDKQILRAWDKVKLDDWKDDSEHNDGAYHPSSLMGCPAMLFLKLEGFPCEFKEPYEAKKMRVFNNGDSVHERVQVDFARAGILDCSLFDDSQETPIHYAKDDWEIKGHADGLIDLRGKPTGKTFKLFGKEVPIFDFPSDMGGKSILEVKSIKGDDDLPPSRQRWGFNSVVRGGPKEEHVLQASIYAWVLGVPTITFLYENKNTQEWHLKTVPADMSVVDMVLQKIELVQSWRREWRKTGKIPKGVHQAARESGKNRKPFGIYAADLLKARLGEPKLEERMQRTQASKKRLMRRR